MRSVVSTAILVTTLWLGLPGHVSAQEPEPTPAPTPAAAPAPPPRDVAVPRAGRVVTRDSEARTPDTTRETPSGTQAERRRPPASAAATASASAAEEQRSSGAQRRGAVRRPPSDGPSGGRATGDRAVPRESAPRQTRRVYVYPDYRTYNRYYDPWGYGAFGLGYFYYSPWGWDPGYYGYTGYGRGYGYGHGGGRYAPYGYDLGSVKLKVKPRDAEVFVDNSFAGSVDDFDGFFQALKLDSGGYRIEIRKPGFQTLQFDVRVQPERTITFRGEMKPMP